MANKRRIEIKNSDLQGLKYFKILKPLLERLHDNAAARDRADNRRLFFDQYACLVLLYFFNPVVTSLRSIQQASTLAKVQKLFGCERAALGSLSEASRVFDPEMLQEIIQELAERAQPVLVGKEAEALRGLTAVDGSLLPALPKMAWALWLAAPNRAAKMHVHFDVLKGVPTHVTVTAGQDSERDQLRVSLQPGGFYVIDRGYRDWAFFQEIIAAGASFVGRVQDNTVIHVAEERPLTAAAQAAGIVRDVVIDKTGNERHKNLLKHPLRIIVIDSGKRLLNGEPDLITLCTNRLDLPAEMVGMAYKYRWFIELFFRWFKCILGCRHLLSTSENGVTIQIYLGIIASLLISLWTGKKPTKRTFEMLRFYFLGWATEEELVAHLEALSNHLPQTK
jgi:Transposase DDE domain